MTHDEIKAVCLRQRERAAAKPIPFPFGVPQSLRFSVPSFVKPYRVWSMSLTVDTFDGAPEWHASIAMIDDFPGTENEFGLPDQGMAFVISWNKEDFQEAKELMAELFDGIIRPDDNQQIVRVHEGLSALH